MAAAEQYPYTFDETNETLLRNFARVHPQGAPYPEDSVDLSELKPDISHTASPTEEQSREMGGENEFVRTNSESPILIRGESSE